MKTAIHFEKNWKESFKQIAFGIYCIKGEGYMSLGIEFLCWDLHIIINWE